MTDTPNSCASEAARAQLRASVRILESSVSVLESTEAYKGIVNDEGDVRLTGVISSILSIEMRLKELADQLQTKQ